ncbi:MAG TPA: ABC transporter ATP-binding protein [Vicinamibacteria bacterium]|nr:ABC transporter ATP-binding protein [Vicinamibacteria bacterium]
MTATAAYETGATILKASGISLTLGGNPILRDINLEVRDLRRPGCITGQVVGLLGPSGIGKTRLFRILAGLDEPTQGQVLIGEKGIPVERGMVGVVAQNYPLFPHRTVLGNLQVAGRQAGLSTAKAAQMASSFLKRFRLEDRAHLYPAQLSGGQQQRVAIAQQFMCSEHFLLMDEPFSGLDPIAVDKVSEIIAEVACLHELNTIIVVTHDIPAAIAVADHLWLMGRDRDASGRIIPGARIQATYDLIERGLAWREGITTTPEFLELLREIMARFPTL